MGEMSERQRRAVDAALGAEDDAGPDDDRTVVPPAPAEPSRPSKSTRRPMKPGDSPGQFIGSGFAVLIVGGLMTGFGATLGTSSTAGGFALLAVGVVALIVGQLMALIGVVAAGVRMGMRWSRYDERRGG